MAASVPFSLHGDSAESTRKQPAYLDAAPVRAARLAADVLLPRAADVDRTEAYPWHNVEALRDAGLMGMTVPRRLGGQGVGWLGCAHAVEAVAVHCALSARIVVESNMGALTAILRYGTPAQAGLAAEHALSGDKLAICITEPDAGSAATDMTTRADFHGDRYVLNGTKHWITGGGVSRLHLVFARVYDRRNGRNDALGIGGFIVLRGEDEGLVIGPREPTMGLRGMPETRLDFENLELTPERALLSLDQLSGGFARLMDAYNSQRVGAAAVALGVAEGARRCATQFTQEREQFGRPICEFQGLQWMLADMSIQVEAARALVARAATTNEAGDAHDHLPNPMAAAQAKVFTSEMAIKVTNDALQTFGAKGYSRNCPLERMVRDARMFAIGGGTAQVLRTTIASKLLDRKLPQRR